MLGIAAGAAFAVHHTRGRAAMAQARRLLLEGDFERARALLEPHAASWRFGAEARAGLALVRIARGEPVPLRGEDLAKVPVRAVLDGARGRGDHAALLALATAAQQAGVPGAAADRAAALLELGRDHEARAALAAAPEATGYGLGSRVAEVLDLRARGAAVIVRDRNGVLLGHLDPARTFQPVAGIEPGWIPHAALLGANGSAPGARLTLDAGLSRLAAAALGAHRGTIVLLEPRTGALLAAVTDAATFAAGGDPAFDQRREPASISKIITATAALRAGLDPDAEIRRMTCRGFEQYGSGSLWCAYPAGPLGGLAHALAVSCNVAFANLGRKIGRAALIGELRRYGFDAEAPGAGRIRHSEGDERQLADLSVGLTGTEITPVHAAQMAAVFAADGRMPAAFLVAAADGALGFSPRWRDAPAARPVLDPRSAAVVRTAMESVTRPGGTAWGAAPSTFPVAMKTGTASEPGLGYHVNYIGVGPMPDPTVAFSVRVTAQPTSGRVNEAAREVLAALLNALGRTRPSR